MLDFHETQHGISLQEDVKCEFCENRCSERRNLLSGVNNLTPVFPIFIIWVGWILVQRFSTRRFLGICEFHKKRLRKGHTFLMVANDITFKHTSTFPKPLSCPCHSTSMHHFDKVLWHFVGTAMTVTEAIRISYHYCMFQKHNISFNSLSWKWSIWEYRGSEPRIMNNLCKINNTYKNYG